MDVVQLTHLGDDKVSLRASNKFCGDKDQHVMCAQSTVGPDETFTYQKIGQTKFTLRSGASNLYCADNDMGQVMCDKTGANFFQYYRLPEDKRGTVSPHTHTGTSTKQANKSLKVWGYDILPKFADVLVQLMPCLDDVCLLRSHCNAADKERLEMAAAGSNVRLTHSNW